MRRLETIDLQEFVLFFRNGGELEFQISRAEFGEDVGNELWNNCSANYTQLDVNRMGIPKQIAADCTRVNGILFRTDQSGGQVHIKKMLPESYGIRLVIPRQ